MAEVGRAVQADSAFADLNLNDLRFFEGGPAYRLMQRIGLVKGAGPSVVRRSLATIAVTWVPLLLLSVLNGEAIGPTPRTSFLLDFACYARFLSPFR